MEEILSAILDFGMMNLPSIPPKLFSLASAKQRMMNGNGELHVPHEVRIILIELKFSDLKNQTNNK